MSVKALKKKHPNPNSKHKQVERPDDERTHKKNKSIDCINCEIIQQNAQQTSTYVGINK